MLERKVMQSGLLNEKLNIQLIYKNKD